MFSPLVSTIIPTYNRSHIVVYAIESALTQDWPNHEVIVVDDGSTDDTESVCRKFGTSIVYVKQRNQGVSSARNKGIQLAKGEFIAFLDSDDIWLPRKLSSQMYQMLSDDKIAVSATYARYDPAHTSSANYAKTGATWKELFQRGVTLATSTILTRKALLKRVGGFREDIKHYEDRDCWLRLLFYGSYYCIEDDLVICRRMVGPCLSQQSAGHIEWVQTSLNLLSVGQNYLTEANIRSCRVYVFSMIPDMVCGSFWHGDPKIAIRLGLLQVFYGPNRISGLKYLVLSCLPGLSRFMKKRNELR